MSGLKSQTSSDYLFEKEKEAINGLVRIGLLSARKPFLALLSVWFMPTNHVVVASCFILSGLLGTEPAAQLLGQNTGVMAILDMVTDRCATMCLLTTLATFYPSFMFLFQISMTIDISCHLLNIHTSLLQGMGISHNFVDMTGNYWMYYPDRKVFFYMCAGSELFYAMLYLSYFTSGPIYLFYFLAVITFPVAVAKSGITLLQMTNNLKRQLTAPGGNTSSSHNGPGGSFTTNK